METIKESNFDSFELHVSQDISDLLKETAKWANFLSILGFIGIGLMVLLGFFMSLVMGNLFDQLGDSNPYSQLGISGAMIGVLYIVIALLYFFPVWYMFQFAKKMKAALYTRDNGQLTDSFGNLKSLFKYMGIFAIIIISIYVLFFVFGLMAAMLG